MFSKRLDVDEFETDAEIEFRREYNMFLLLRVSELLMFIAFKVGVDSTRKQGD